MACMCGDTHCPSCGPAQGNWKCPICGQWADDCCEHISEETGELKPEFQAQADEAARVENEMWDQYAKELEESDRLAEEWRQKSGR
jgi:uncharacterized Zn finger protein (UPF0148 family)